MPNGLTPKRYETAGGNVAGALDFWEYLRVTRDVMIFAAIDRLIASCQGIKVDYRFIIIIRKPI